MAEYIDRNYIEKAYIDLCKALSQKSKICPGANEPTVKDVFALVMHAPVADVVEVRHGHWIDLNAENSTGPLFKCSECSHLHNPNRNDLDLERVELKPIYCDACGARMDKEDEHEAD